MPTQFALQFDEVPLTCSTQERYHAIAPILAGKSSPAEQAELLNLGYSTVTRWLRHFREKGMPGCAGSRGCIRIWPDFEVLRRFW
jgi:hypothetical protein